MTSVEEEYKLARIKSAIKLNSNDDSTISLVRAFEENAAHQVHQSLVKVGITLDLSLRTPSVVTS